MQDNGFLQVYDLELRVLSPLFIGSGHTINQKVYLFDARRQRVSIFDENKFFQLLVENDLISAYERFMLGSYGNLYGFLTKECGLRPADWRHAVRYELHSGDALDAAHSLKEIHVFQRNAYGQAYIPGSSIKGALRTVLLNNMILEEHKPGHLTPDKKGLGKFPEDRYLNQLKLSDKPYDAVNSIMRGIQISDSQPIPDQQMILAGKTDADVNGSSHSINLCRECVCPGTKIHLKLTLDQSILHNRVSKESVVQAIAEWDRYFSKTYSCRFARPQKAKSIPESQILYLGGGAGFFSKALVYPYLGEAQALQATAKMMQQKFRDHGHNKDVELGISPHTMKYTKYQGSLYPVGACEVAIL